MTVRKLMEKYKCINCNNEICFQTWYHGTKQCKSCTNKNRKPISHKGSKNPNWR